MNKKNQKQLHLSKNKLFLGVLGGISEYFDFSTPLIRVLGTVMIAITGIVPGILIYLILASVMKVEI